MVQGCRAQPGEPAEGLHGGDSWPETALGVVGRLGYGGAPTTNSHKRKRAREGARPVPAGASLAMPVTRLSSAGMLQ
jgi:hypothetical protein